jgi:hypothetical protein
MEDKLDSDELQSGHFYIEEVGNFTINNCDFSPYSNYSLIKLASFNTNDYIKERPHLYLLLYAKLGIINIRNITQKFYNESDVQLMQEIMGF